MHDAAVRRRPGKTGEWRGVVLVLLGVALLWLAGCSDLTESDVLRDGDPTLVSTLSTLWEVDGVSPDPSAPKGLWMSLRPGPDNPAASCFAEGCHAELLTVGAYLHQPFVEGKCRACHALPPDHAAHPQPHQVTAQDIALCYNCHPPETLGNSHPVGPEYRDPRRGTLLTCTSTCHDPHGGPYRGGLRFRPGGALCLQCHHEEDL